MTVIDSNPVLNCRPWELTSANRSWYFKAPSSKQIYITVSPSTVMWLDWATTFCIYLFHREVFGYSLLTWLTNLLWSVHLHSPFAHLQRNKSSTYWHLYRTIAILQHAGICENMWGLILTCRLDYRKEARSNILIQKEPLEVWLNYQCPHKRGMHSVRWFSKCSSVSRRTFTLILMAEQAR